MENLTYEQKISILRILLDIAKADNLYDEREIAFFDKTIEEFGLDNKIKKDVESKSSLLALAEISNYSQEQKEGLSKLMGQMIVIDKDINYNEIRIYNVVNDFCKINNEFNMEDYPDLSRSGDFIPD